MPLEPGSRLGPFEVLSRLGAGGMGEVWRARDTRLQRDVAIKVLPEAFAQDADRLQRFTREAHVLAALNHPNIAAIYSFEETDDLRFLVLELVSGETLKQRIVRAPVSANEAIRFALQIADALEAAHAKGVLHRDLKPANVNVTPEGKVKLLDFGLAKAFALGAASPEISHTPTLAADPTHQGVVLGTASYMSPEQARGRALDGRSDLWSFGCVLYEMLAGKKVFDGESVSDILVAILDREPDWAALPAATPAPLRELMKRLLQKDPAGRPASIGDTRGFLEAAAGSRTTAIFPASGRSASAARRGGGRALLVAGSILLVVGAALLMLALRERAGSALPASKLLAILPATDLTGRPDGRQLCDGVSISLGVKLQGVPNLAIMPPSSPAMLKETDPAKWARDTGANLLVQPAVRQMGELRQLSFSLSLAGSPVQIAAGEVTGPSAEHFKLEEELARKLVAALRLQLSPAAATPAPASVPAGTPQTDYVVALGYLERRDDVHSIEKAEALLQGLPEAGSSALIQGSLARARLLHYFLTRDPALLAAARDAATKATTLDPAQAEAQLALGQALTESGKPGEAVPVLDRLLEKSPANAEAWLALGRAQWKAGSMAVAEVAYRRAAEVRPTAWYAWNSLGGFLLQGPNKYEEAAGVYRKAIALNPDAGGVYSNLGATLIRLGRSDEAKVELRKSIEIQPTFPAYINLGLEEYLTRNFEGARAAFEKAAALAPRNGRPLVYLGDAQSRLPGTEAAARASYEKALPLLEAELRQNPSASSFLVLKARCQVRIGDRHGRETLERAVALAPKDTGVLYQAAAVAAIGGWSDLALGWLGDAHRMGLGSAQFARDPDFDPLRKLPAFDALMKVTPPAPTGRP